MAKRHRWKLEGKGWWECVDCGMVKEKHFGFPFLYYGDSSQEGKIKAPECLPQSVKKD